MYFHNASFVHIALCAWRSWPSQSLVVFLSSSHPQRHCCFPFLKNVTMHVHVCPGVSLRAGYQANWLAERMSLPAWLIICWTVFLMKRFRFNSFTQNVAVENFNETAVCQHWFREGGLGHLNNGFSLGTIVERLISSCPWGIASWLFNRNLFNLNIFTIRFFS